MADNRPGGHKRSKSSLALSLLHRDRPKRSENDDMASLTTSNTESPSGSPVDSHQGFGILPPDRVKKYAHDGQHHNENETQSSVEQKGLTRASSIRHNIEAPKTDLTIQQSVKTFRWFEILRSGDRIVIANAVKENGQTASTTESLKGTTILHLAIQCAEPPVVEQLLSIATSNPESGINLNAQDRDGNTPLQMASILGRATIVRLLLGQPNADSTTLNYQGRSALDLARSPEIYQQLQLARSLYTENQVRTVHHFVRHQDYDGLEKLLEDPRVAPVLDVNSTELVMDPSTTETGGTLLHESARKKDIHLIQLLLLHEADPFRRDRQGKLPQDVTRDERTRAILKSSPAAVAAQRGIQEKAILGGSLADNALSSRESREMKGYLKKWTNYTSGYKLRWFVLEDGVLSYYKHQDDADSACRGAMNMRIAQLTMDAQDKSRFEIHGKSSVKYHLKANHTVEAKRWFWALNNAIQWAKDEARDEEQQKQKSLQHERRAFQKQTGQVEKISDGPDAPVNTGKSTLSSKAVLSTAALSEPSTRKNSAKRPASSVTDDQEFTHESFEDDLAVVDTAHSTKTAILIDDLDDDEEYGENASSREVPLASKDAFNLTAQSAHLQLELLAQVSGALHAQSATSPATPIADPIISQALDAYEGAVQSLRAMVGDLLRIARDRELHWQQKLEREADLRCLWESSMAKVAREHDDLEGRIEESEEKRKRTKRALREALEGASGAKEDPTGLGLPQTVIQEESSKGPPSQQRRKSLRALGRPKSTFAALTELSDCDSDSDEEFFDAVGAGEVEVVYAMPMSPSSKIPAIVREATSEEITREIKAAELAPSSIGYEDPVRKHLKMEADDRPKISLWSILKSMIGKDMTKMTLPVSFNEPTSLLQRVAEDMEYTDLLDTAAGRLESTERIIYVAAFAASEYASTIGRVAKPFNPLLGETYEYVRPDKGYRFFIEQVSHHPPIGAAWAESTKWDYYGESAVKSKFYGKSFDINPLGTWFLKLRPTSGMEELYTWKKVTSSVVGIITGSPTVDNHGSMEIKNWTTGEVCTLDFKPRGWTTSSAYQVSGKVVAADGKTRWSIGGRWNDKLYARLTPGFESTIEPTGLKTRAHEPGSSQAFLVWEASQRPAGIPFNLTPFVVTLNALPEKLQPMLPPTDTRLRPDQRAMEHGEYDLAATEKNRVEEKQRAKRREREAKGNEYVPRWFSKGKCAITGEEYWLFEGEYWRMREGVARGEKWANVEDIF